MARFLAALCALLMLAQPVWAVDQTPYGAYTPGAAMISPYYGVYVPVSAAAPAHSAIHYDTATYLALQGSAFPGLSDSPKGTISFWWRCNMGAPGINAQNTCNVQPLLGNLNASGITQNAEAIRGLDVVIDNASGAYGTFRVNLNDATGGDVSGGVQAHSCNLIYLGGATGNVWTHWLISWDFTSSNRATIYKNGAQVISGCNSTNYTGAYPLNINLANAGGFAIFPGNWTATPGKVNSGAPGSGEIADLFMDFTASVLDPGVSTISAANIAKFYNAGAPVDLGTNCATPLGVQPQFCFSGNKSAWYTNKGTLGQGGATQVGQIWNASTGPSNTTPPHAVYNAWAINQTVAGATSVTTNTGGNQVALNDLLILSFGIADTSKATVTGNGCTTDGGGHCSACPDVSWTTAYHNWNGGAANNGRTVEVLICYKIAGAGDVGAPTYTINWTTAASLGSGWQLHDFKGVDTTTPVEVATGFPATAQGSASSGTNITASTNVVAPSITPTSTNDLLVSQFFVALSSASPTFPSDMEVRIRGQVAPLIYTADRQLTGNAATGTETLVQPTSQASTAVSLALKPN